MVTGMRLLRRNLSPSRGKDEAEVVPLEKEMEKSESGGGQRQILLRESIQG